MGFPFITAMLAKISIACKHYILKHDDVVDSIYIKDEKHERNQKAKKKKEELDIRHGNQEKSITNTYTHRWKNEYM